VGGQPASQTIAGARSRAASGQRARHAVRDEAGCSGRVCLEVRPFGLREGQRLHAGQDEQLEVGAIERGVGGQALFERASEPLVAVPGEDRVLVGEMVVERGPADVLRQELWALAEQVLDAPGDRQRARRTRVGNNGRRLGTAGWEFVHVCIDDATRLAYVEVLDDEKASTAIGFLHRAVKHFASYGITVERLLTDNGSAFRSRSFAHVCHELGVQHRYTRPYRPQTNGKAERFIQSALREWAYGFTYQNSQHRTDQLDAWIHHYNWHRPHQGIGGIAPMSRLGKSRNNLLALHN